MGLNNYLDKAQTMLVFAMGLPIIGIIITKTNCFDLGSCDFWKKIAIVICLKTCFAWSECTKAETCRCARQLDPKCSAGIKKPAYWGQQASQLAISSD